METKPIMEEELKDLEQIIEDYGSTEDMDRVLRLIAEVRRLHREAAEHHDELIKSDDVAADLRNQLEDLKGLLRSANERERALGEKLDAVLLATLDNLEKPRPMCRPDPLGDIYPPARGEGSLT